VHSEMLPVAECRRYGASVGFCNATTEMMLAPSLELLGVSAKRDGFGHSRPTMDKCSYN